MTKNIAILQSSYIPWKGYFDIIKKVDEFILFDNTQYTKRDWRSRNKIKTAKGAEWLTIPVKSKAKFYQKINETIVANHEWPMEHWKSIQHNYNQAPYFSKYAEAIFKLYQECLKLDFLSSINYLFIRRICDILDITTPLTYDTNYHPDISLKKSHLLIDICQKAQTTHYLSGPSAKNYIDEDLFKENNITLSYISYEHYPTYRQLHGDFTHHVSILDLLFNEGPMAQNFF